MVRQYKTTSSHHNRVLDRPSQLSHVAAPSAPLQFSNRFVGKHDIAPICLPSKVSCQQRYVALAISQSRHSDLIGCQTRKQIVSEGACPNLSLKISLRC